VRPSVRLSTGPPAKSQSVISRERSRDSGGFRPGPGAQPPPSFVATHNFLRATAECFVRLSHHLGVCLSVTLVICIKTVQARITKFSPWDASRSLVFHDKILCPWVRGFPSNEGVKEGYPLKVVILPLLAHIV